MRLLPFHSICNWFSLSLQTVFAFYAMKNWQLTSLVVSEVVREENGNFMERVEKLLNSVELFGFLFQSNSQIICCSLLAFFYRETIINII